MSVTTLLANLQSRLRRLQGQVQSRSTRKMSLLHILLNLIFSYRTLLLILAITNLKNIPFSWHYRLFGGMFRNARSPSEVRKLLRKAAASLPSTPTFSPANPKPLHPIFRPLSYHTRAPMYECDYNFHKSNSTYFSDLDVSRGNLVSSLMDPAIRLNVLVPYGVRKGLCYPILGAVHTSFLREIKPYEAYEVRSRIMGWDRKWIVIGSWFVRRATQAELRKDKESGKDFLKGPVGKEEVVFAYVMNKYVIKAGRMTVPPELALAASGWFPVRPEATASIRAMNAGGGKDVTGSGAGTGTGTPQLGPQKAVDTAANTVHNVAIEAGRRLSLSGDKRPKVVEDRDEDDDFPGWSWEEIEEERLRGLKFAEQWLAFDGVLRKEYEMDMSRGIID